MNIPHFDHNGNLWCDQHIQLATSEEEAKAFLGMLACIDGFLGGRIIPSSPMNRFWQAQAFATDGSKGKTLVLRSMFSTMGINL